MTLKDRGLHHQLHPAKLLTDWATAVLAAVLLWQHRPVAGLALGFGPSLAVSLLFLSGRVDDALERLRNSYAGRTVAPHLSADVDALRLGGLAIFWTGCWSHAPWLVPVGLVVIVAGWWLAWRRGAAAPRALGPKPSENE